MTLDEQFEHLSKKFRDLPYSSAGIRKSLLNTLKKGLEDQATEIAEALNKDFSHRSRQETMLVEILPCINALSYCFKHTKKWMKQRKRKVSWLLKPASAALTPQPLGVVGIVVPWNYPLLLAIGPMAYAIAAGNRVMIKMSELTPATGELLQQLIRSLKLDDYIAIINGDVEVSRQFVGLPFGHLLFTGSTEVGKKVMKAAADNVTPVTLELGGKSPAVLSRTMKTAYYNRLFMGKLFNAGQTCIAPDYILAPKGWEKNIAEAFQFFLDKHYPNLISNDDYTAIISDSHKKRILHLIEDAQEKGADVRQFGELSSDGRKLPVYLVFNVNEDMKLMQEEIFGPILPVLQYESFEETMAYINANPCPLSVYYFGEDKDEKRQLRRETLSGSFVINDTIMHIAVDDLPYGGVGRSGMGRYHGQEGFDTFSNLKAVFIERRISLVSWFYPPYGKLLDSLLRIIGKIQINNNQKK